MVRIIPSRLKSSASISNTASSNNSRATSPMRNKGDSASPEGRRETGLVLNVVILRGRNLAAKDRSGTSDPYLVLNCGDSKHVTATVSKSLNPEWNEQCEFPINGAQHLLLDVCAWDKDRFGKDYMGEFDLALEEIFLDEKTEQPPKWYPLKSKRPGKKTSVVSGEVLLQFTIFDASNRDATRRDIYNKLMSIVKAAAPEADASSKDPTPTLTPVLAPVRKPSSSGNSPSPPLLSRRQTSDLGGDGAENGDEDYEIYDDETPEEPEEADDPNQPEVIEKRKRRLRIKGLKRKKRDNGFEFSNSSSDVVGIIFLEIRSITDLPPEHNFTRTSFDCDPFVVASLGKKTYRTRTIRHNLNPVFNEKMLFQVLNHEQQYSFSFTVIDRDKFSGNDFIASVNLPIKEIMDKAPRADPSTGLYELKDPPEYTPEKRSRFMRLSMSRSASSASLSKLSRPSLSKSPSVASTATAQGSATPSQAAAAPSTSPGAGGMLSEAVAKSNAANSGLLTPTENAGAAAAVSAAATSGGELNPDSDDPFFVSFELPLKMKNLEKWEDKHSPVLYIRAKYMPYPALRQQFWRALLRQYDANESGEISKVELTTMLDTLGSTLRDSTIDSFFQRFPHKAANGEDGVEITMDEAVLCLEDQLSKSKSGSTIGDKVKNILPDAEKVKGLLSVPGHTASETSGSGDTTPAEGSSSTTLTTEDSTIKVPELSDSGMEGEVLERGDDLNDRGEEHVVMIRECPICHQPRLNRRKDADIITHISTCASQDWRQVNNLMMAGFVTASQAHRKWYSKVITKISYGGYKLGANSANILVQDRLTGQINEEKMSVYVRLGIRLLYKGLKSNSMENKRIRKLLKSLSIKQGKKYDDPASTAEIQKFIEFHNLDMSEVLLPIDEFKSFNEFFYRALKPGARPCSAPDRPRIIVSPADCRCVVFNRVDVATKVWIKGRDFSIKRLLGDAYPEDAKRYENGGGLGIFRLAPQDYHRFHIPVDGVLGKPKTIAGEYYTVNPMAIRSALDVYGENVRVVVPIDSPEFGRVMVVCIGAMMVGSTVITRHEGDEVKRAEELGYFKFGGSTLVVLFEEGKMKFDDDLVDNSNGALETLVRVGMSVGHHVNEPQWTPDMRKNEDEITEQDKKDAKRRIQGAEFSDMTPEDSGPDESPAKPSLTTRIAG